MTQAEAQPKNVRILIVEDDEDMRGLLVETVNRLGYSATATEKAKEALASIERGDIDLVMLDLKMPGVGGLDLLKVIRRRQFPIPVIVVSGFISEDIAKTLAATGVQGMVAKPFKKAISGSLNEMKWVKVPWFLAWGRG